MLINRFYLLFLSLILVSRSVGAVSIDAYLQQKLGKEAILEYKKSETVTAGYRVTVEDLQLDASLENQLEKFKDSVLNS